MRRYTRTGGCIAAWVAILAIFNAVAPNALANTYQVRVCNYAPEGVNNSWVWKTNDPAKPAHYASHTNCPYTSGGTGGKTDQESGLSTTDALGLSNGAQPGTNAEWTFTTPPGTTITAINYERYLGHMLDSSNDWSPALRADGTLIPAETCLDTLENGETCHVGGPPGNGYEPAVITGLSAQQLTLGIYCQAPAEVECVTGATQHKAWAAMYGASVTVNDPTPPTLNTPTGPLLEPGKADGFHKGSESVTISAQDIGGGVQAIALDVDGQARQTYSVPCDFTFPQPCPAATGPQILTLATTELSDGAHTLALVATDAAGNQSTLTTAQITVDNDPPTAPSGLKATATQPGGMTFNAEWADPSGQASPITTATYQVCPATGPGACSTLTQAPAAGPAIVTVPGPGNWTLSVWLTDAAGNSNPANATYIGLTVPESGGGGSGGNGGGSPPKTVIRVKGLLHGRKLLVRATGPATGKVRLTYTARYHHKVLAHGTKTVAFKHGHAVVTFMLNTHIAAHATIGVAAIVGHRVVRWTLPRPR